MVYGEMCLVKNFPVMKLNSINVQQNEERSIDLLCAQRHYYSLAKCYAWSSLVLCVVFVAMLSVASRMSNCTHLVQTLPIYSTSMLFLHFLLKKKRNNLQNLGAQIQNLLDVKLFDLSWNSALCGSEPKAEKIGRGIRSKGRGKFLNWYGDVPPDIPLTMVSVICMRMNIEYDLRLKSFMSQSIHWFFVIVFIVVAGAVRQWTVWSFLLYFVVPLSPVIVTFLDIDDRLRSDSKMLTRLEERIEVVRKKLLRKETVERSELQDINDNVFSHRQSSPLVPDFVYNILRKRLDATAHYSSAYYYEEMRNCRD